MGERKHGTSHLSLKSAGIIPAILETAKRARHTGIQKNQGIYASSRIVFNNTIALTIICLVPIYGILFYALGYQAIAISLLTLLVAAAITIGLNAAGQFAISKIWTIIIINSALLVYSLWFGKEGGVHYLAFVFLTFPFSLFNYHQTFKILIACTLPILVFAIAEFSNYTFDNELNRSNIEHIKKAVFILTFVWLAVSFLHFTYLRDRSEQRLKEILNNRNHEINEGKSMQKQILESNDLLERKNAELLQASLKLKHVSYKLSHEIRKPLANLLGLIHIWESDLELNYRKDLLNKLEKESQNMDTIVKEASNTIEKYNISIELN